jgi:rubrerythrin
MPTQLQPSGEDLNEDNHLFGCGNCGHTTGDPSPNNFYGTCPACELIVRHFRLIE